MHHSWHPVHFPLRGGTWQWILGNRDLAGAATAEKTSLTVVSAQSLVQPGAACWLNVCAGRYVLRLNAAVLILTHEGAGAADQAEKAAFRRESSTFTAEKTERGGEERRGSLVSAGVQAQWAKVQVQSGSDHIRDLHGGSRNGSAALHVFLLCRIKSTATFFPWKAEKQPSINGKSRWEAEDRLRARCFSVSQKNRERFKLKTGKLSRRHGNINLLITNYCLDFSTQCGDISKGAEGSTAHNKSSSSCRGEEVDLPPTTQSLSRASVDSSDNKLCRAAAHRLSERTTREETQHIHLTYRHRTNCLVFEGKWPKGVGYLVCIAGESNSSSFKYFQGT